MKSTNVTKLGLLSDLHGDAQGLQVALEWFDAQGVSQVLCAGDISDRGSDVHEIVAVFKARGIICIAGNHDRAISDHQEHYRASERQDRLKELGRIVDDETLDYLVDLPANWTGEIAGSMLMMGHGTPTSDVIGLFPDSRTGHYRRLVENYPDVDIMILGHTHFPMDLRTQNLRVINPGSIYALTIRDSHSCAILHLPSGQLDFYDVKHRRPLSIEPSVIGI
ncbi:MAG: metallophosphoesterase family protein [Chloroflexi bacterium]|nr:metallophosphoesterase family protein [Chloroflexota bacterium]